MMRPRSAVPALLPAVLLGAAGCQFMTYDSARDIPGFLGFDGEPEDPDDGDGTTDGSTDGATDETPVDPGQPDLVTVPAGTVHMGCNDAVEPPGACDQPARANERPLHPVVLAGFRIQRHETRQSEYDACVKAGKCTVPSCEWEPGVRGDFPVTCVTWDQARTFCENFRGLRLPTEAEWERAARDTDALYPWGGDEPTCGRALYADCGQQRPGATGLHAAGATVGAARGIHDLAGNAAEWVQDWYDENAYRASSDANPTGPESGTQRVVRGGSAAAGELQLRASVRSAAPPDAADPLVGFRCVAPGS